MTSGNQVSFQKKDKLTIKHLPLSISNDEIKKLLEDQNVILASPIRYGLIRDEEGQLTTYKSGDRFVFVEPFDPPLPRQQKIGTFHCTVLYHGKMMSCRSCGECGHKVGDSKCKAKPKKTILAFKGYTHPLSNHFPCKLKLFGKDFKSVEHIRYWRMALELGKDELAKEIHGARHAGEAKRLGKNIADEETRWDWEEKNVAFMSKPLRSKSRTMSRVCTVSSRKCYKGSR